RGQAGCPGRRGGRCSRPYGEVRACCPGPGHGEAVAAVASRLALPGCRFGGRRGQPAGLVVAGTACRSRRKRPNHLRFLSCRPSDRHDVIKETRSCRWGPAPGGCMVVPWISRTRLVREAAEEVRIADERYGVRQGL